MLNDDRGVSPVIGVILMVAITVILAAVIGTFVLGLGDQLGDSQPTAQLDVSSNATADNITINHNGGDRLTVSDLRIEVAGTDETSAFTGTVTGDNVSVGDSVTFTAGGGFSEGDRLVIVHEPSDSILFEREL
ncbi:type IV pilin [Halorubrum sp. BOL3-1]|uniref:type IV pilin n=1 Tax=Halorubrum sp. BOL3-1 TaxID=2497325 RepID=UPI001004E0FF|nr:type IV pilin N-terminal domain-containing protein [Halorubrum sp. BOL3-1]QAU13525.1 type IV pilin [Halorubrum sp. BOL3-1]